MPARPMTSDEQIVYKNMVDNLSFMKRQQWVITSYAVAIFIGLFGLTQGRSLSADAIQSLVFVVKLGCLLFLLEFRLTLPVMAQLGSDERSLGFPLRRAKRTQRECCSNRRS